MGWIAGDRTPSSDELFLLELVARRTGMVLDKRTASTRPPPRFSEVRQTIASASASASEMGHASGTDDASAGAEVDGEQVDLSYEAYLEWSKRRTSGDRGA